MQLGAARGKGQLAALLKYPNTGETMQAIHTKYLGPTNARGARVKATAQAGSATVPYNYALNIPENHEAAARALADRLGWGGKLLSGALPDSSYAHVFA